MLSQAYSSRSVIRLSRILILIGLVPFTVLSKVYDVAAILGEKKALRKTAQVNVAQAVEEIVAKLQPGDALRLPDNLPLGRVTIGDAVSDIEVSGGLDGEWHVKGKMRGWKFLHAGVNMAFIADETADLDGCYFFCSFGGKGFTDKSKGSSYTAIGLGLTPPPNRSRMTATDFSLAKGSADPVSTGGTADKNGKLAYNFPDFGDKVVWMPKYYMPAGQRTPNYTDPQVFLGNANGGKWLFAIEANQGNQITAVRIKDSKRLQMYHGSTEGVNKQDGAIYDLLNSEEVVIGMRRFFSNHVLGNSWQGEPVFGLKVEGGKGNIIHNLVDIGNPKSFSMISTDPKLQIWQTFFEDKVQMEANTFQFAVTHEGMISELNKWTEPVLVDKEVIMKQGAIDLLTEKGTDLPTPPAFDFQSWQGKTAIWGPAAAKVGSIAQASGNQRRYAEASTFGAAFLQAGADPTGLRPSDAAFEKILATTSKVEIPTGRFRITKPIKVRWKIEGALAKAGMPALSGPSSIFGAGPGKTIIVADPDVATVLDFTAGGSGALSKSGATPNEDYIAIDGISVEGGETGILFPDRGLTTVVSNFRITGLGKSAITFAEDAWFNMPASEGTGCADGSETRFCNDAHLFEGGEINGYDYGVHYPGFADKMGFKNVTFKGQKKAGISATNNNLFHGWIGGCKFIDINGPGVDLSGGNFSAKYGYLTQWVTMIEDCVFENCGSETRAALDYGLTDINMFCNSKITGAKPIKYGFLGSVAQISNVLIDVKASKAAMALRNSRVTKGSRTPATIVHTVKATGKMLLVDAAPNGNGGPSDNPADDFVYKSELSDPTWAGANHSGIKWWQSGQYDWSFPVLVYNSEVEGKKYGYVLMNSKGFEKDLLTGTTALPGLELSRTAPDASLGITRIYDLHGKEVKPASGAVSDAATLRRSLPRGLYFIESSQGKKLFSTL